MNPPDVPDPSASIVDVRSYFVRHRNALAVRADFAPLFIDYYLHQADNGLRLAGVYDEIMKDALMGLTLHLASRPWQEQHAWTLNLQKPLANFFVTGDNNTGMVTGRGFTQNVKRGERSLFYAQMLKLGMAPRQSTVEVTGHHFLRHVEQFYAQSEQRLARFFAHGEEDYVFITAQPQCDVDWLMGLTDDDAKNLDRDQELSLLETRQYRWGCGCSPEKLYGAVLPHARQDPDALFAGAEVLHASCPRCGQKFILTREQFEAWLSENAEM
jgi:molecular chaperone Hsp33